MEKIPTVGELFKKYSWTAKLDGETLKVVDKEDFKKAIIECTKFHVKAALKAASEKAKLTSEVCEVLQEHWFEEYIDEDSILNSYPLNKIK